jgi:hypothetical protein
LQKHLRGHNCHALCTAEQQSGLGDTNVEFSEVKLLHKRSMLELLMYTFQQSISGDVHSAVCCSLGSLQFVFIAAAAIGSC